MTRAKRYEGEALRAEAWHNMGVDKAWERERVGFAELSLIAAANFNIYCKIRYDPVECGYLVVTSVTQRGPMEQLAQLKVLFKHEEPALEFPSEHLKTKLLLITGGTLPA